MIKVLRVHETLNSLLEMGLNFITYLVMGKIYYNSTSVTVTLLEAVNSTRNCPYNISKFFFEHKPTNSECRIASYLSYFSFEMKLAVADLVQAAKEADLIIFVVPHQFVRTICSTLLGQIKPTAVALSLIKVTSFYRIIYGSESGCSVFIVVPGPLGFRRPM